MALTPPPLPSSSEDSDFDDDDFGCFSSAPVKTVSKNNSDVNEAPGGVSKVLEDSSLGEESGAHDGSDNAVSDNDLSGKEQGSTDLFSSDRFDEVDRVVTTESNFNEEECDNSDSSEIICGDTNSKETETINQITDDKSDEDSFQNRTENTKHSIVEDESRMVECVQKDNSACVTDGDSTGMSDDVDTNLNQMQDDASNSRESVDLPCEDHVEGDDFGDWNDMQSFQSNEVESNNDAQSESPKVEEIYNDCSGIQNEVAATDHLDKDHIPRDPSPSHSPRNDSPPNIPLDSSEASEDSGNNQHLNIPDNGSGFEDDNDEDGFDDFADFSSHQVKDRSTGESVPPLSFKTDVAKDETEEKNDSGGETEFNNDTRKSYCNVVNSVSNNDNEEDDFDDDWGFKSAETNGNDDFGDFGSPEDGNEGSDWASFNDTAAAPAVAANVEEDYDDFNDFNEGDFQAPAVVPQSESLSSKAQESTNKVEKVVFMCFPDDSSLANQTYSSESQEENCDKNKKDGDASQIDDLCSVIEMGLNVAPKAKEETWTIVKELRNKDPLVGTWGRLKDVNSSHALDYGWSSSHCCQEIFSTLRIDTKNVLFSQKKQAVPFYASGLGILEPTRGGPVSAEKIQPPIAPTPALLDTTSKPEEGKKTLDIPPVDFDWGSSGLTNPLKVFKNDSLNNGLSSLEPFSDVLHKNIEPTKELSSEAKSILSKLPNLKFMRSNVLMFPIKD